MHHHTRWAALALLLALGTAGAEQAGDDFKLEPDYISLFNGKDLTGWKYMPTPKENLDGKKETADKRFYVMEGAIVAAEKDKDGKTGIKDLYTVQDFDKDFNLKLEFRAGEKADSGVYLRGQQLQVRDYLRRGEQKQLTKYKNDGWNLLDITVKGGVVSTSVNGKAVTDEDELELTVKNGKPKARLNDQAVEIGKIEVTVGAEATPLLNGEALAPPTLKVPSKGGIGVQAETGKFEFRRIRVKELK